tara:strand:+ start:1837 stop:2790 length:954 start_codon:yes stop_codon:yes gene_type:complete
MKIAFYQDHICLRGSTVTMYDYANGNQDVLGNSSVVFYNQNDSRNNNSAIKKFKDANIEVIGLDDFSGIHKLTEDCQGLYQQKGCGNDGRLSQSCRNYIQQCSQWIPHSAAWGDVYAYTSDWLRRHHGAPDANLVPCIVTIPEVSGDLREELGIPHDAIVFARTGGTDTWNLPWSNDAVRNVLDQRPDIYFLMQNTHIPFTHDRIINVKSTADETYKVKFINSCDAMIHARKEGESFGIACGEFSLRNKPIITWNGSVEINHIEILGDKGIYYSDRQSMINALLSFAKQPEKDWNCYRDYSPEKIMPIFESVFINEL